MKQITKNFKYNRKRHSPYGIYYYKTVTCRGMVWRWAWWDAHPCTRTKYEMTTCKQNMQAERADYVRNKRTGNTTAWEQWTRTEWYSPNSSSSPRAPRTSGTPRVFHEVLEPNTKLKKTSKRTNCCRSRAARRRKRRRWRRPKWQPLPVKTERNELTTTEMWNKSNDPTLNWSERHDKQRWGTPVAALIRPPVHVHQWNETHAWKPASKFAEASANVRCYHKKPYRANMCQLHRMQVQLRWATHGVSLRIEEQHPTCIVCVWKLFRNEIWMNM